MKKTMSESGAKAALPVSKKFYAAVKDRVTEAMGLLSNPEMKIRQMLQVVDAYLLRGLEPTMSSGMDVMLVFALLKPELDRAKERSQRSRRSAALRRKAKEEAVAAETQKAEPVVDTVAPANTAPLDRRTLRRFRQAVKKQRLSAFVGRDSRCLMGLTGGINSL